MRTVLWQGVRKGLKRSNDEHESVLDMKEKCTPIHAIEIRLQS